MAADYQLTLNDYLSIIKTRVVLIGTTLVAICVITVVVAVAIPPVFRSTGTILVESQQIPADLVPSTVTTLADERIQIIKQRVMTRENLFRIADKYSLFENTGTAGNSETLDAMRDMISLELISADLTGRRRGTTTIAFKLSFEHRSPDMAHKIANELVTLFLQENAKASTERATETTEFVTREAEKLKVELEALESQVAAYKQQHGSSLPEHLDLRMSMLQRAESDLRDVTREYKSTQEELRFLDVELAAVKSGATTAPNIALSPAQELEQLRAQHVKLTGTYTATHPDVRALSRKIASLEKQLGDSPKETAVHTGGLEVARIQAKVDAANVRLASLDGQHKSLQSRIRQLEAQILQTPQVERGLITLMRDHENAQKKYEEVRAKQVDAQMAQSLEQDRKAERFALLEPPLRPDRPVKPDRPRILLLGFLFALGGAGGLPFLLEMLNQRVRGAGSLTQLMQQAPLVVIPYITTNDELSGKKSVRKKVVIGVGVAMLVLIVLVHFLYQPLNILFFKLIARLG